jgi:pimeloyl-ACP methyl ester carboxylesterase
MNRRVIVTLRAVRGCIVRGAVAIGAIALVAGGCGSAAMKGHVLPLRGIKMYYATKGVGPPILLLHGGAGNGLQFLKQIPAFSRAHRLIVPDCRAQGRTTDRPGPLTYHDMAEDMVALLDHLHVRRVDVMGWSDGGIIGLDLAINHPKLVRHLVTFGANFAPEGLNADDVEWDRTATADSFGPQMRAGWRMLNPEPDHYEEAMNKILEMWRTLPRFTPEELHSIQAKTMICAGDHDVVRPEHTAALARAIPGAILWIVPNASHSAIMEFPDLVNARVLDFLRK